MKAMSAVEIGALRNVKEVAPPYIPARCRIKQRILDVRLRTSLGVRSVNAPRGVHLQQASRSPTNPVAEVSHFAVLQGRFQSVDGGRIEGVILLGVDETLGCSVLLNQM